jgi:fatty-acyl-CoA synthase
VTAKGNWWVGDSGCLTVADVLRSNATSGDLCDAPLLVFEGHEWSYRGFYEECSRFAALFSAVLEDCQPRHVGVLGENTPDYLFAMGGAALSGCSVVTLNVTQREEALTRDIRHTDVRLLVVQADFVGLLSSGRGGLAVPQERTLVSRRFARERGCGFLLGRECDLELALGSVAARDPGVVPVRDDTLMLTFTSGTSGAPKAVPWTHGRLMDSSAGLVERVGLVRGDVAYMAMPLFHANSVVCNWIPCMLAGAAVAMVRKFSASGWLGDVRRFGATYANYVGKPLTYVLSTPERPDDAENPLRVMFGNEGASPRIAEFSRRFGVKVFEAYGTSEGGISMLKDERTPTFALGPAPPGVRVVDEDGRELSRAKFDELGRLVNPEECVGLLVQTEPVGAFTGYYRNERATAEYTRDGWLWTGDLAYMDEDGYVYFAGRGQDWIRVDGENFLGGPIEEIVMRYPGTAMACAYGVPDPDAGDQVMVCVAVPEPARFDVAAFCEWLGGQRDLSSKWRPRFIRVCRELPMNGSNKVLKRVLMREKFRLDAVGGDPVVEWGRGAGGAVRFDGAREAALYEQFVRAGRERFWDL